jgi:hypothetical protein
MPNWGGGVMEQKLVIAYRCFAELLRNEEENFEDSSTDDRSKKLLPI